MPHRFAQVVLLLVAVLSASERVSAADRRVDDVLARLAELRLEYASTFIGLAGELSEAGEPEAAAEAQRLAVPPDPRQIVVTRLPQTMLPDISADLPPATRVLRVRLRKAREQFGSQLYLLSRQALVAGSVQTTYALLRESAVIFPDDLTVRRMLGFVRQKEDWLTPFEAQKRREGSVWHEQFGWLRADQVPRYERGERYFNGRWITAEQEAEFRRDFRNAWVVRTEHYLIRTNHSLERGVEVAKALENFHDFFVETFAGFFTRPADLQVLYRGSATRSVAIPRQFKVHYYATREEYNQQLVKEIPNIAITNGLYLTKHRVAYFFHTDAPGRDDTLYHEATHQLMYESLPNDRDVAMSAHFWVVEGIACYMESFRSDGETLSLGDPRHIRIRSAVYRYLEDNYYVPLAEYAAMGLYQFQAAPEISKNYSQAAGLAHFFMHYDKGRYRDALIEHLAELYQATSSRRLISSLNQLTGVTYAELDRQYGEYMRSLSDAATARRESP